MEVAIRKVQSRPTWLDALTEDLGCIGVCIYLGTFWIGFRWDIPLISLSLCAALAFLLRRSERLNDIQPVSFVLILLFLGTSAASALAGRNWMLSLRGSVSLLPALLLFIVICFHFTKVNHFLALCFTFSAMAVALTLSILYHVWSVGGNNTRSWIEATGSSILAVPNDLVFLAILAPFALVQIQRKPKGFGAMMAYFALALSLATAVVLRSRVTFLALFVSLIGTSFLVRPRLARLIASVVVIGTVLLDGLLGFRLISRFTSLLELGTRVSLWSASVRMFLAAPMLGQGPHTFGDIWRDYLPAGPNWIAMPVEAGFVPWPHNLYLELLSERGMVAAILFTVLSAQAWLAAWRLTRSKEGNLRLLGCSVSVALMTFFFASLFELTFLRLWVAVIWFVLIAVVESLRFISQRT